MAKYQLLIQVSHPGGKEIRKFRVADRQRLFVGRKDADILLPDPKVSRRHLGMAVVNGKLVVADLKSSFGTTLGGKRIRQIRLRSGETLRMGESTLTLKGLKRGTFSLPALPKVRFPKVRLPWRGVRMPALGRLAAVSTVVILLVAGVWFFTSQKPVEKTADTTPRLYFSAGLDYTY